MSAFVLAVAASGCVHVSGVPISNRRLARPVMSPAKTPPAKATHDAPTFEPMSLAEYRAAHPQLEGLDCGIDTFFDTFINVFGVTIAAMPNTPVPEIIHAAKIYAQLLDSDQDFVPDDERVFDFHQGDPEGRNILIVLVDTKDLDNAWIAYEPCQPNWVPAQALRPGHSGVGHSRDGEFDIAVEELFHRYGKSLQSVYPADFGLPDEEAGDTWSSTLSNAVDQARGLDRSARPIDGKWIYPEGAWYTYDATSCGWGCMIDEYLWSAWATNIGYQSHLTRAADVPAEEGRPRGWCENQAREWKPCTREELRRIDPAIYNLLNSDRYALPQTIPFGEYGGDDVEFHGYEVEVHETDSGARFSFNRNRDRALTLRRGKTYYFDQSLESNSGHRLRFSTVADGSHAGGREYTEGVSAHGRAGERGAYVRLRVRNDAPVTLHIYSAAARGASGKTVITTTP